MVIWTDGSSNPNPGPGGFGIVVTDDNGYIKTCFSHREDNTTNNRQEIKAILMAYLLYGVDSSQFFAPVVYSDSAYAVNTFNNWMFTWQKNDWKKSDNKTPENLDLIQMYYDWYQQGYRIDLRKTKGHIGTYGNELADRLAGGHITPEEVMKNVN